MKTAIVAISLTFICFVLASCLKENLDKGVKGNSTSNSGNNTFKTSAKDSIPVTLADLEGNWKLVNDSTNMQFWGLWSGRAPVITNYFGKATDYYNFTAYGKLYVHDNAIIDSQTYKLARDTVFSEYPYIDGQTNQVDSAYNAHYVITLLTQHSCTLTTFFISPETASFSTINLSR